MPAVCNDIVPVPGNIIVPVPGNAIVPVSGNAIVPVPGNIIVPVPGNIIVNHGVKLRQRGPTVTAMYRSGRPVRGSVDFHATIERALAQERGSALGRAGRRLEEAIDTHRLLAEVGSATTEQIGAALGEVTQSAWALMVQREYVGFRSDNLAWLRAHYDIPPAVLRRL